MALLHPSCSAPSFSFTKNTNNTSLKLHNVSLNMTAIRSSNPVLRRSQPGSRCTRSARQ